MAARIIQNHSRRREPESRPRWSSAHGLQPAPHLYLPAPDGGGGYLSDRQELQDFGRDDRKILCLPHQDALGRSGNQHHAQEEGGQGGGQGTSHRYLSFILKVATRAWRNGRRSGLKQS